MRMNGHIYARTVVVDMRMRRPLDGRASMWRLGVIIIIHQILVRRAIMVIEGLRYRVLSPLLFIVDRKYDSDIYSIPMSWSKSMHHRLVHWQFIYDGPLRDALDVTMQHIRTGSEGQGKVMFVQNNFDRHAIRLSDYVTP